MRRLVFCLAFLPLAAFGQIQLFQFDGTTETPAGSLYQVPPAASGDNVETRFRARNTGVSAVTLQTLTIAGEGFRISAAPSLPYVIAPTAFADFKVLFSPSGTGSYSANILVNSLTLTIRGTAVAGPTLAAGSTTLAVGATVNFGKIQWGTTTSQTFTLSNPNSTSVTVSRITVTGAGFQGPGGITTPLTLSPGQPATFQVTFAPIAGQTYTAKLAIDQRIFNLTGIGLDPLLPTASIQFGSPTVSSALQTTLSIQLATASLVAGTGTLVMEFHPSVTGVADDPAVLFLSGPARIATLTISPGDSIAKFGAASNISFQTGATAGTIEFTLKLGSVVHQASLTVAPAAVSFDTSSGTVEAGSVIVGLAGYDNTYSASQLKFTFYDTKGQTIAPGAITVDVSKDFAAYFKSTQAGGAFQLRADFLVSGDSVAIGGVDVAMTNTVGVTSAKRITF